MKTRLVIITIDSVLALMKDYCGSEQLPEDTWVEKLLMKPTEQGRFGLVVNSEHWPSEACTSVIEVKFDLQRFYGVGGGA